MFFYVRLYEGKWYDHVERWGLVEADSEEEAKEEIYGMYDGIVDIVEIRIVEQENAWRYQWL